MTLQPTSGIMADLALVEAALLQERETLTSRQADIQRQLVKVAEEEHVLLALRAEIASTTKQAPLASPPATVIEQLLAAASQAILDDT